MVPSLKRKRFYAKYHCDSQCEANFYTSDTPYQVVPVDRQYRSKVACHVDSFVIK